MHLVVFNGGSYHIGNLIGNYSVDVHTNTQIANATIEYTLTTKRFDESLFHC